MTRVRMRRAGAAWQLEVEGHAGHNPGGPDIVCGAVSMLCCALGRALKEAEAERGEAGRVRVARGPGVYDLTAWPRSEREWGMIRVAEIGFMMLAEKYPENVVVVG